MQQRSDERGGEVLEVASTVGVFALTAVAGALVGPRVSRWFADRERRRGRVEFALRTVAAPGEDARWQHGLARPGPGHLTFVARGPFRWPSLSHETMSFPVTQLSPAEPVRRDLRTIWSVNPRLHVVRFESHGQVHEIAARPGDLEYVRARIGSPTR